MRGVGLALAIGATLVAAGSASARQSGYVFLQCDYLPPNADRASVIFRIGGGQWDYLRDGAWWHWEAIPCNGQSGTMSRQCTFAETYFRSQARGVDVTISDTINRMTGRYDRTLVTTRVVLETAAQCRPIAEPSTAERKF